MSLSSEIGFDAPTNHVLLPVGRFTRMFDRDFTIREIVCESCKTVLCALIIAEEHEADMIWPFDVVCEHPNHKLVTKGSPGAAKVFCHGKPVQEWEAKKYLEKYKNST